MPLPALLCLCAAAASLSGRGDYRLAGLFPLRDPAPRADGRPPVAGCDE